MNAHDVIRYYEQYQEDNRLTRDKSNYVEYLLTFNVVKALITTNNVKIKLIDVGCGTGRYSIALSKYCEQITACDIVDDSLKILQDKINHLGISNINILNENAMSLNSIQSNEFDIVLCMGPLYHLDKKNDRDLCLNEMARILKKGGVAVFSYLSTKALWMNVVKGKMSMKEYLNIHDAASIPPFYFSSPNKIIKELEEKGWQIKSHCAVDPISCFFPDIINSLNDDEYNLWLQKVKEKMFTSEYLQLSSHNILIASLNETT